MKRSDLNIVSLRQCRRRAKRDWSRAKRPDGITTHHLVSTIFPINHRWPLGWREKRVVRREKRVAQAIARLSDLIDVRLTGKRNSDRS